MFFKLLCFKVSFVCCEKSAIRRRKGHKNKDSNSGIAVLDEQKTWAGKSGLTGLNNLLIQFCSFGEILSTSQKAYEHKIWYSLPNQIQVLFCKSFRRHSTSCGRVYDLRFPTRLSTLVFRVWMKHNCSCRTLHPCRLVLCELNVLTPRADDFAITRQCDGRF